MATTKVNASTAPSTAVSSRRGTSAGPERDDELHRRRRRAPRRTAPPASESTRFSVSHCATRRPRPAPSARRIAVSRRRDVARASSRFDTFAHAISSTRPTAPTSTSSAGFVSPTTASCTPASRTRQPLFVSGYAASSCALSASTSACAAAMLIARLQAPHRRP